MGKNINPGRQFLICFLRMQSNMNTHRNTVPKLLMTLTCLLWLTACTSEQEPIPDTTIGTTIWSGPNLTFTKAAGASTTEAANQDRLTDRVWITRGNSGGQIFNANVESSADKDDSPVGTLWAEGDIANAASLVFRPFRAAVGQPKDVVGKNLVLFLPDDNIMLTVRFTSWDQGRGGGFSYVRSTP